jgi:mitochondrial import receptor subunit TOM40
MNYMQAVTPKLALGGEGMYIAANQNMLSAYTAKYNWTARTDDDEADISVAAVPKAAGPPGAPAPEVAGASTLIATYNTAQAGACLNYKRVVTPNRLTLGAELTFSPITLDSQFVAAAEFKWQRSKLNLAIDGGGRIQSLLEAKYGMGPGSPTLMFSADMDHLKDEMKFGCGITIDS